jgi:preprotein translocase subunit YajC
MYCNVVFADASAPSAPAQSAAGTATQGAPAGQATQPPPLFAGNTLIFIALIAVMMYFLMIRPQQQRSKQLARLLASIKSGDRVATSSGIVGTIVTVKEKTVSLRSGDAKMEVTKSSITEILESGDSAQVSP